jgi:ribosomal protein S27AE
MAPSIVWIILGLIAVTGVIWLIVRTVRPPRKRQRIHGATCPKCGSTKVFWAGYSDRKECGNKKCGKIFS